MVIGWVTDPLPLWDIFILIHNINRDNLLNSHSLEWIEYVLGLDYGYSKGHCWLVKTYCWDYLKIGEQS